MKPVNRLLFKLAVFSMPFLLVLAFPLYVMGRSGELISSRRIIELQERNDRPRMICPAYNDPWGYVKLRSAKNRGAEVLALGTSRVMMIRQTFFQTSFYNGARGISEMKDFKTFLESLPEKSRPKVLLMGIDPNLLNPSWIWAPSYPIHEAPPPYTEWLVILGKKWMQLYWDIWKGVFDLGVLSKKSVALEKVGLIAKAKDKGFLNDGSYLYQDFFQARKGGFLELPEKRFEEDLTKVRTGEDVYVPSSIISEQGLRELVQFLEVAKRMRVHVIGYIPPYAPMIHEALQLRKQDNAFLYQLGKVLGPLFQKHGFSFYDYKDPGMLFATDDEFYDGVHDAGEVSVRLVRALARNDTFLANTLRPVIPPSDVILSGDTGVFAPDLLNDVKIEKGN